jgi:hypothetical protein
MSLELTKSEKKRTENFIEHGIKKILDYKLRGKK